jgi:hypothetical protein
LPQCSRGPYFQPQEITLFLKVLSIAILKIRETSRAK